MNETCPQCGKPLTRPGRQFCDRACSNRWQNARRRGKPNPKLAGPNNPMYGRPRPAEVRERISQKLKGMQLTPEQMARKIAVQTGSKRSVETKEKMSQRRKEWWANATPEQRARFSEKVRRNAVLLRPLFSELKKEYHRKLTPEQYAARVIRVREATLAAYPRILATMNLGTSIEHKMAAALDGCGIAYDRQVPLLKLFVVDFLLREVPIVIECDGDYWHSRPEVIARDAKKNEALPAAGYTLLRFSEATINTDIASCVRCIEGALASHSRT